jgi:hypothetical protein
MGWLTALIAVVLFVWLLIKFPRFRIVALLVVGSLALLVFLMIRSNEVRERESHSFISASQLDLKDVTLHHSFALWEVAGTVRNNSRYTLHDFSMKVTVRDCPDQGDCVVIGEEKAFIWVTVPSSQIRAFKADIFLHDMPKPKNMSWSYQIVETTANKH